MILIFVRVTKLLLLRIALVFVSLCMLSFIVRYSLFFFFFSSRRRHTRFDCDWSSDVCSSDLAQPLRADSPERARRRFRAEALRFPLACPVDDVRDFTIEAATGALAVRHYSPRSEERRVGKECRSRWSR